jgi:putative ABC transport system permease protein
VSGRGAGALRRPSVCGLRLGMLAYLLRRRVRAHPGAELLAGAGIAVGVALVFGVLLANASLTSSAATLVHALAGDARLELVSPSSQGFPQSIADRAGELDGVEVAAPLLRRNVTLVDAHGARSVQLLGLSPSVEDLGGASTQELAAGAQLLKGGIGLPAALSRSLHARRGSTVLMQSGGRARRAQVRAVLGGALTPLAQSPVAVAVLSTAQRLTGSEGQVSAVLIRPLPGRSAIVARELRALAGARLQVRPADAELRLLDVATAPNRQSTSLFTAIAVMIGFLLALSAVLLTVPERRRFVADLQLQGYAPAQVTLLLGAQALLLGLVASTVGIGLGDLLARLLFQRAPDFLAAAFPVGAAQSVQPLDVLAALACGVAAALLASLGPLVGPRAGAAGWHGIHEPRARSEIVPARSARLLGIAAVALIALASSLALAFPALTIAGGVALALATVCLAPLCLLCVVRLLPAALERLRSPALIVALQELRAVTVRGSALGAIVALALFGAVAIGGAREDLLRGIAQATRQYFSTAPVWVSAGRDVFNMNAFPAAGPAAALRRQPQVASVRVYRGGLLDVGQRRMWVRARPAGDSSILEASQLVEGGRAAAEARIRSGGWAAVSSSYAEEAHLRLGQSFTLPTPAGPRPLRLAAITTNSGWPPGTITIAASEYAHWWGGADAAALEVSLKPGVAAQAGKNAVQATLARVYPGLRAQTAAQRALQSESSARQGLRTLQEISSMLLAAAALAVASALAASIWQRRRRLASLKLQGYESSQLWGAILIESGVTVAAGASLGGVLGVGGHALASRFLALTTGFPAPFAVGWGYVALTLAVFCAVALGVIALPGRIAAGVPAHAALQE